MVRSERRLALRSAIEDLRRYRATFALPHFLVDRDAQRLVLHALYVATQASIDEAQQRVSEWGLENRGTYRDAFIVLAQSGRLPLELGGQMALWASMRNVLAHFYPVLDLRRVHAALDDIEQIATFEAWLRATDDGPSEDRDPSG